MAEPFDVAPADDRELTLGRILACAPAAAYRHWTAEDLAQHEAMGFHAGWGVATEQLEALARTL